jgi:NADP-dependent 3-hydroxy acid dehydrogenase YdfG
MQSLTGKRVLVTGASSGIGRETALQLAASGASVVATGRTEAALRALSAEAGTIAIVAGDLTSAGFIDTLVHEAGAVDILINNAGALKHAPFLESDPLDWRQVFDTNVLALLGLTQAVARGMVERRAGHIINITSMLARRVAPFTTVYSATKHAVAAIGQGLRHELRPFNIRVTEIAPGVAETNVFRAIDDPGIKARYAQQSFERLTASQVAEAILFAARTDHNACPDLIEIKPVGQE